MDALPKNEMASPMVVDVSTALCPCDADAVPGILEAMLGHREQLHIQEEKTRIALLAKARDLVRALESPRETMVKHLWAQVSSESPSITPWLTYIRVGSLVASVQSPYATMQAYFKSWPTREANR